jgi:serine/threonine-protein kinase
MPITTSDKLIEELRGHSLLSSSQLAELEKLPERPPDSRDLAREIVKREWLTKYQANLVYQGRGKELFLGPYVLIDKLGEGGMGEVYRARHQRLERVVALKLIRTDKIKSKDTVSRFQREARAAAQLSHPNIVTLFDDGQEGDIHYLAMEYVKGVDLSKWVREKGPMPVPNACNFIRQAALGLQHAHERGLVHRDIKPSNLMLVAGTPQVKVLDMGLARIDRAEDDDKTDSGSITHEGAVMGTPDFLAPEQAMNAHSVDIRADIYSLGCSLHFLLTAQAPFPGGALSEKLLKHQLQDPPPLAELRPDAPAELGPVLKKMMAKKPEQRYQTPADVAAALAPFVRAAASGAAPVVKRPAGPPQPNADTDSQRGAPTVNPEESIDVELASDLKDPPSTQTQGSSSGGTSGPKTGKARPAAATAAPAAAATAASTKTAPPSAAPRKVAWLGWAAGAFMGVVAIIGAGVVVVVLLSVLGRDKGGDPAPPDNKPPEPPKAALTLDDLKPAVAADEQYGWQPKELVAVLGTHKWRHWAPLRGLAYLKTGELVSYAADDQLRFSDGKTGAERLAIIAQAHPAPPFRPVVCSPDGAFVATLADNRVNIFRTSTGREEQPLPGGAMAFSPDSKYLAVANGGQVDLFAVTDFRPAGLPGWPLKVGAPVTAVAFAPHGGLIATANAVQPAKDKKDIPAEIKLWTASTGQPAGAIPLDKHVTRFLVFSSDGALLATGAAATEGGKFPIVVWDVSGKKEKARLEVHRAAISGLALTAERQKLVSASMDGTVRVWSLQTMRETSGLPLHDAGQGGYEPVLALALAPDDHTVAVGCRDGAVRLYDLATGKERDDSARAYASWIRDVAISHDRVLLAEALQDKSIKIVEAGALKERPALKGHTQVAVALAFAHDDKLLYSASVDKTVGVWDVVKNAELPQTVHAFFFPVYAVAVSPDGKQLAAGSHSPFLQTVEAAARKDVTVLAGHTGTVLSVAYFPEGRPQKLASTGQDGTLRIWDATKGKELFVIPAHPVVTLNPPAWPASELDGAVVAISPKGKVLVTAGADGMVRVWDAAPNLSRHALAEQIGMSAELPPLVAWKNAQVRWTTTPAAYKALAFSPDGKVLAVGCERGGLVLYDTATWKATQQWKLPGAVARLTFDATGRHLVSVNGNGTAYVLRLR